MNKKRILKYLGLNSSTYYNWHHRYNMMRLTDQKPVGKNPFRLLDWEKEAIRDFYLEHQQKGYRRITYMMLDQNIVAISPSTVYRYLKQSGLLMRWAEQRPLGLRPALPTAPNQKWHTDLMILEIDGINYYYQGIIDAYSRYIIAWDIHAEGTALNTSLVLQEAYDKSPEEIDPVVIADNGPEFIGKEFREVIKVHNGKDVRITAYHPQSNGIEERFHRTLREECIVRYKNLIDAKQKVSKWIEYYNRYRLHSSIEYMPPEVWHFGNPEALRKERKQKLNQAKKQRQVENLKLAS
jgi:transposase InsO family protein